MELGSEFDLSFEKITKKENNLYQYLESYMVQWYDSARSAIRTIPHPMERSKQRMLSTLVSLYKLLGTGNFFKVLLLLLKAFFA